MDTFDNKNRVGSEDSFDFQMIFNLLRANKWLLAIILSFSLAIAYVYTSSKIPQYKSEALFQVDAVKGNSTVLDTLSLSSSAGSNFVDTEIALIKSRFILDKVVDKLSLDVKVVGVKHSLWDRLFSRKYKPEDQLKIRTFDVPQPLLNKRFEIIIEPEHRLRLISSNGKEILSGNIGTLLRNNEAGISLFVERVDAKSGTHFGIIKYSKTIITNKLISKLNISEMRGNVASRGSTGILNMSLTGEDPKLVANILNTIVLIASQEDAKKKALEASQTLEFLHKQLPSTKQDLLRSEKKLNAFRAKSGKIDLKYQAQYLLTQFLDMDKRLEELGVERVNLLKRYTEVHPAVSRLESDINTIKEQRRNLEGNLKLLPKSEQQEINLSRDVKVKQSLYLLLLNKIQELQVVKAGTVSGVISLSKATLPDGPVPVKKLFVYFVSMVVGFVIFVILVLGRRILSPKVVDPHWVEREMGLPSLAILPYCDDETNTGSGIGKRFLVAHKRPKNITVEALRSLRTSLLITMSCGVKSKVISLLGVSPGVGKSFVSSNLAYLLATADKKVIILDCDLRAGTIHKYFNSTSNNGLADCLLGKLPLEDVIKNYSHVGLDFISRGSFPKDPSELLMSDKFKEVIEKLSSIYDVIVLDTPPVALVTDALVVARFSEVNYMVVGAGDHHPVELENSVRRLSSNNISLNGYIFNFNKKQKHFGSDSYGYYYNSKYYYISYGNYFTKNDA